MNLRTSLLLFLITINVLILSACAPSDNTPPASLGNADVPILVEEFSDFQCPLCGKVGPELEDIISRNSDIARLEFHHFPLPYHDHAFRAAEAAECAGDLGKFWEFAKLNFANQKKLNDTNLKLFAKQLELDQDAFNACFDGNKKRAKIKADMVDARSRGLSFTPSIYVNGNLVQWSGAEQFEAYLKSL